MLCSSLITVIHDYDGTVYATPFAGNLFYDADGSHYETLACGALAEASYKLAMAATQRYDEDIPF